MVDFERKTFTDNFGMTALGYLNAKLVVFMMVVLSIMALPTTIFSFNGSFV